ncbi:MAG: extracellular solute-binding protein [Actinobacteria bacterium]|nr:extracellular solute-binding protein [Actinomycetota bacterium]
MKKKLLSISVLLVIILLLSTLSLSSCKTTSTTETTAAETTAAEATTTATAETTAAEPVTLEWWSWNNEGAYPNIYKDVSDRFTAEHPNVKIEMKYVSFADYKPALKAAIAGGEAPDIFQVWPEVIAELAKSGAMVPLDDYFAKYFPEIPENVKSIISVVSSYTGGKNYVVPLDVLNNQIAYNVEMFKQYGLEVPKTTEDLVNLAKTLADKGKFAISVGTKDLWVAKYLWFGQNIYTDPSHTLISKADRGEISWVQPELKESVQRVIDMLDAGVFAPGANSMDAFVGAEDLFTQQKAAMYFPLQSSNKQGVLDAIGGKFTFSLFPFPHKSTDSASTAAGAVIGSNFAVSATGKNSDLAVQLIAKLYDQKSSDVMYENGFIPSFLQKYTGTKEFDPVYQSMLDAQKTAVLELILDSEYSSAMLNGMQGVIGKELTAEEFLNSMDAAKKKE